MFNWRMKLAGVIDQCVQDSTHLSKVLTTHPTSLIEHMGLRPKGRFQFIDFARGVVMAIMAWDHVSGFWNRFHRGGEGVLGNKPAFISLKWWLARYVSHFCAPTFIFLAGTVLAISTIKREVRGEAQFDISGRMVIRGIVLLVAESLIVAPAFGGNIPWAYFGVIACIGLSFIIFSVARRLPNWLILALSLFIVFNHNFINLDFIPNDVAWGHYLRVILHEPNFEMMPWVGLYPILPWLGVMGLGWVFGSVLSGYTPEQIRGLEGPLRKIGLASIGLFIIVRGINGYGNLLPRQGWSPLTGFT